MAVLDEKKKKKKSLASVLKSWKKKKGFFESFSHGYTSQRDMCLFSSGKYAVGQKVKPG